MIIYLSDTHRPTTPNQSNDMSIPIHLKNVIDDLKKISGRYFGWHYLPNTTKLFPTLFITYLEDYYEEDDECKIKKREQDLIWEQAVDIMTQNSQLKFYVRKYRSFDSICYVWSDEICICVE